MQLRKKILILTMLITLCIGITNCTGVGEIDNKPIIPVTSLTEEEAAGVFYQNPSDVDGIGDPFVLSAEDGYYYCYATSWSMGYLGWRSLDLVNWERLGVVFRGLSKNQWASTNFWAPEVVFVDGKYYMYYSALGMKEDSMRIGVAVSDTPDGPFVDVLGKPLFDFGYAVIDANVFIDDDGSKYIYYSKDCSENIVNGFNESHIYGIRLGDDMVSVVGEPVLLCQPEQPWEIVSGSYRWNEGAFVFKREDTYYMMYSGNFYANKAYSVGYAVSDSPLGTFAKYDKNPILQAEPSWTHVSGPGHNSVVASKDGKELYAVYHTHTDINTGGGERQMCIDRIGFRDDGTMYINGPSTTFMPFPSGNGNYINMASKAHVEVSSGSNTAGFLTDNQIGFYTKFVEYDWVGDAEDKELTIKLTWDNPIQATAVMIYDSALNKSSLFDCSIRLDDGTGVEVVEFPDIPGSAASASFAEKTTKSITITLLVKEELSENEQFRLSEIIVLGKE